MAQLLVRIASRPRSVSRDLLGRKDSALGHLMLDAAMESAAVTQTGWDMEDAMRDLPKDSFGIPHLIYLIGQLAARA